MLYLVIGLCFRLSNIRTAAPSPDEQHWLHRSAIFLERLHKSEWTELTTHMGHPGIPAAVLMAGGEALAIQWNSWTHAEPHTRLYIDSLAAARLAVVTCSSIVFLVMILFSSNLIGLTALLLGTMFFALDCQHIALTRIAHIDGILTLLATSCLFLGFSAERANSTPRKLLAGALWGLAIATKPTALALLGCFFVYKVLRRIFCSAYEKRILPLLDWSDIWAVVVGHIVLGSIYTKLWNPYNTYITKHHILPPLSDLIARASERIDSHPTLLLGMVTIGLLSLISLSTMPRQGVRYHAKMLLLLCSVILISVAVFPIVSANLVRFWYWVGGLSNRNHEAYGMVWSVPGLGYPEHWFRRLPSIVIIGLLPALYFVCSRFGRISSRKEAEQTALLLALALAPVIWTLPLAVSNKQTIRYVVPMFPALFLFSAWGFIELWRFVAALQIHLGKPSYLFRFFPHAFALSAVVIQAIVVFSWAPNYALYFNSLSGGIKAAYARGYVLGPVGYEHALDFLHKEALKAGTYQRVEVIGDLELMKFAYSRMYPEGQRGLLKIQNFREGMGAEWVLEFPSIGRRQDLHISDSPRFIPVFKLIEHGATVYTVYKVPLYDYKEPVTHAISHGSQRMGELHEFGRDGINLIASPTRARAGYIHFNQYVRVPAGRFKVSYRVALLPEAASMLPLSPEDSVIRLELSSECSRVVAARELSGYKLAPVELECTFDHDFRGQLSVYWFGKIPVRLGDIDVQRLP